MHSQKTERNRTVIKQNLTTQLLGIKAFLNVEGFFIPTAIPLSNPKKAIMLQWYISPLYINKCCGTDRLVNKVYSQVKLHLMLAFLPTCTPLTFIWLKQQYLTDFTSKQLKKVSNDLLVDSNDIKTTHLPPPPKHRHLSTQFYMQAQKGNSLLHHEHRVL